MLINRHEIRNEYSEQARIVLYEGDAGNFMATVPDNSVRLIVTSPPYNLGKDYLGRRCLGNPECKSQPHRENNSPMSISS